MPRARPRPPTLRRLAGRALVPAALLAAGTAPIPAGAQSDREMLATCLDTFEGRRLDGRRFTRDYGRHVLYCNFRVDMLDGYDERRDAYERWRTQVYQNEQARMAASEEAPPPARPRATTPTTPPPPSIDGETMRFATCLTERADALALTEPDLDQDPARARLLAREITEACLEETSGR